MHDCRHIAATDLYIAGIPERQIMDIAGWKTTMLTTYRHADSLRSAQDINARYFRNHDRELSDGKNKILTVNQ
jgi:integrase